MLPLKKGLRGGSNSIKSKAMQTPVRRLPLLVTFAACLIPNPVLLSADYDALVRNATIYDGSASAPFVGDVAINRDNIAAVGPLTGARGRTEIDATGLAVAPGFINMLSWATESLLEDGRSQGDLR